MDANIMRSVYGGPSKPTASQQHVGFYHGTFDTNGLAEALDTANAGVQETESKPYATPTDDDSASIVSAEAGVCAADGAQKQLSSDEQLLLDELEDILATFDPLERTVKVEIPTTNHYILVHGDVLMQRSPTYHAALTGKVKKDGITKMILLADSTTVLVCFLKWVYTENLLPAHDRTCRYCLDCNVNWPDFVNLWIFAGEMGMPKLQNHIVDILVRKIRCSVSLSGSRKRTDEIKHLRTNDIEQLRTNEIEHLRTALDLLWDSKHHFRPEALKPLRSLMLDYFANPLYQTKADAYQLLAGSVPRGFFFDYTLHTIEKNFHKEDRGLGDENDFRAHLEVMEEGKQDTWGCVWTIKSEKYYVSEM